MARAVRFEAEKIPEDPTFANLPCEAVALALTVTGDSLLNGEVVGWAARPTIGGPAAHPTAFGPTLPSI